MNFFFPNKRQRPDTDLDMPLRDARFVVVDTELTGLDLARDSIVSIGAVRMTGARICAGDTMHLLVDPEREMRRESVLIHRITPSDVQAKPVIDEALYEFFRFLGDDIIAGWCVGLDMGFLNREMKRITGRVLMNPAVDARILHDWLMGRKQAYRAVCGTEGPSGLFDVAKSFGIPVNGAHSADADAYITAQLFQRQVPLLEKSDISTVGKLLKVSEKGGEIQANYCGL